MINLLNSNWAFVPLLIGLAVAIFVLGKLARREEAVQRKKRQPPKFSTTPDVETMENANKAPNKTAPAEKKQKPTKRQQEKTEQALLKPAVPSNPTPPKHGPLNNGALKSGPQHGGVTLDPAQTIQPLTTRPLEPLTHSGAKRLPTTHRYQSTQTAGTQTAGKTQVSDENFTENSHKYGMPTEQRAGKQPDDLSSGRSATPKKPPPAKDSDTQKLNLAL